jgi:two-component system, NtrC family, response regulator HydG
VYSYLLMTTGARTGTHFLLKPAVPTRIGRGLECDIVLSDPLSSRVHATIVSEKGDYWVRDAGSRNGTFVSGQKIDEARLVEGSVLRVGSSEFTFHQSAELPVDRSRLDHTQTIVHDRVVRGRDTGPISADLSDSQSAQDLFTLHQLAIRLLGCTEPDEVIRASLELLHQRTKASIVGFLWMSDDGQLKPKIIFPEGAMTQVRLSQTLTEMVVSQAKAVWVNNQKPEGGTTVLQH